MVVIKTLKFRIISTGTLTINIGQSLLAASIGTNELFSNNHLCLKAKIAKSGFGYFFI
jgi:hypothetical protein